MIVRFVLVVACLAGAAIAVAERRDLSSCDGARETVFRAAAGGDRAAERGAIDTIREDCRGTGALLNVAGALRAQGETRQALVLAREAVDDEPDNAAGWRAVLALSSGSEAEEAEGRLRELDPRSLKRSSGRSTR